MPISGPTQFKISLFRGQLNNISDILALDWFLCPDYLFGAKSRKDFLLPLGRWSIVEFFKYSKNLESLESDTLEKEL